MKRTDRTLNDYERRNAAQHRSWTFYETVKDTEQIEWFDENILLVLKAV